DHVRRADHVDVARALQGVEQDGERGQGDVQARHRDGRTLQAGQEPAQGAQRLDAADRVEVAQLAADHQRRVAVGPPEADVADVRPRVNGDADSGRVVEVALHDYRLDEDLPAADVQPLHHLDQVPVVRLRGDHHQRVRVLVRGDLHLAAEEV